jgi:hypothetical protein
MERAMNSTLPNLASDDHSAEARWRWVAGPVT